jgi:hypothetical protein
MKRLCPFKQIFGSNPIRGTDICLNVFCVYVVLCLNERLASGLSPGQGVNKIKNLKKSGESPTKSCIDDDDDAAAADDDNNK